MNEPTVLGVDGGGTRTRVVLAGRDAGILGVGVAGPSSLDGVGLESAERNLGLALAAAWRDAGLDPRPVAAAFWGVAGVTTGRDHSDVAAVARRLLVGPIGRLGIDHDIRISLAGGLAGHEGIAVIAGTGSSCYGRSAQGRTVRVGGWGHVLDDRGSGFHLGSEALHAIVRAADGRAPATALTAPILARLGIPDVASLMGRVHAPTFGKAEVAALAPDVVRVAAAGDTAARRIVSAAVDELALLVATAAGALDLEPPLRVVMTGGLVQAGGLVADSLAAAVAARVPGAQVQLPVLPPVLGAVLLALGLIDSRPPAELLPALSDGIRRIEEVVAA